jgi:alpha-galactosidase
VSATSEPRADHYRPLAELPVDLDHGSVYEHGWQSWSPSSVLPVTGSGYRAVRPEVQTMCYRYGGLRASSDRIADLDQWGLETTRRLLASPPPPTPFDPTPAPALS